MTSTSSRAPSAPTARAAEQSGAAGTLDAAIAEYRASLADLKSGDACQDAPVRVLRILTARDDVATLVGHTPSTVARVTLPELHELDQQLQAQALWIDKQLGRSLLASWRLTRQPPSEAWWWRLDERAAATQPPPSPAWAILAGFCIALSLSLIADISRRFLSVGPDLVGVLSIVSQTALAVLAGSALTDAGRKAIETTLGRLGINTRVVPAWKFALALTVLVLVVGVRFSLPWIARRYNEFAEYFRQQHQITSEIDNYQRAVSLDPDYFDAHYNLGSAYEDVLDFDRALSEYQRAYIGNPNSDLFANDLARLLILRRSDFSGALSILDPALTHDFDVTNRNQVTTRYTLLKNRAWALLGLNLPRQAEADLTKAMRLPFDAPSAHCLMAQVLERVGRAAEAHSQWDSCLADPRPTDPPELVGWRATARQRSLDWRIAHGS